MLGTGEKARCRYSYATLVLCKIIYVLFLGQGLGSRTLVSNSLSHWDVSLFGQDATGLILSNVNNICLEILR